MGKKGRGGLEKAHSADFSDTSSIHSESVVSEEGEEVEEIRDTYSILSEIVEQLEEKRTATRVQAVASLSKLLTTKWIRADLLRIHETCTSNLIKIGRKATGKELEAAMFALLQCFLTAGYEGVTEAHSEYLFSNLSFIIDHAKPGAAKAAAIRAFAVVVFVLSIDEKFTLEKACKLEEIYTKAAAGITFNKEKEEYVCTNTQSGEATCAALDGWTFLLSASNCRTISMALEVQQERLKKLLYHSSLEVRESAGEALAFLFEAFHTENEGDDSDITVDVDELSERLNQLSTESDKGMKKKDRSQQRRTFRNVRDTIAGEGSLEDKIVIAKQTYTFNSWQEYRRLEMFRSVLGAGFHIHAAKNDVVRDILCLGGAAVDDDEEEAPAASSKKVQQLHIQTAKRAASKGRDRDRSKRAVAKNTFIDNPHFDE